MGLILAKLQEAERSNPYETNGGIHFWTLTWLQPLDVCRTNKQGIQVKHHVYFVGALSYSQSHREMRLRAQR